MKKSLIIMTIIAALLSCGCTNMNPNVAFDPEIDADAYCEIGMKDSKTANKFWTKVDKSYREMGMTEELKMFEEMICSRSQSAKSEIVIIEQQRMAAPVMGEVTFYPEEDAETYISLKQTDAGRAQKFYEDVKEQYNTDGCYEEWEIFQEITGTATPE